MGISLGKVNYCVSELASKGWIKITRFKSAKKKIPYTYPPASPERAGSRWRAGVLTPKGLEEKGQLTLRFLKRKLSEYDEIKKQIRELHCEAQEEGFDNPGSELADAVKSII
jgi:hypothetical protein